LLVNLHCKLMNYNSVQRVNLHVLHPNVLDLFSFIDYKNKQHTKKKLAYLRNYNKVLKCFLYGTRLNWSK